MKPGIISVFNVLYKYSWFPASAGDIKKRCKPFHLPYSICASEQSHEVFTNFINERLKDQN